MNEEAYEEELNPASQRPSRKKVSPSVSPENSPSVHKRISLFSKQKDLMALSPTTHLNSMSPTSRKSRMYGLDADSPRLSELKAMRRPTCQPIIKKKAVFKEYTQSRDRIELPSGTLNLISNANSFAFPQTTMNNRKPRNTMIYSS